MVLRCSTATTPAARPHHLLKTHKAHTDMNTRACDVLSAADVSGIIAMAWSDDTPFEAIEQQFGLSEAEVIALMRDQLKTRSFRVWRIRVRGRPAKHGGRNKMDLQSQMHPSNSTVQSLALNDSQEDFPVPSFSLTQASLQ
ncbi:MAG: hypothetical protein RJB17_863 [Pseudomonadota bacterium]|jgi:uncharacterized protein (TIGR03643 family)